MKYENGFSILELLISMAIIAIIAAAAGINLVNYYRATALEAASKDIVGELRLAQNRALMSQDGDSNNQGDKWGIRFTNGADDYYETFYGNVYNVASTTQKYIFLQPLFSHCLPCHRIQMWFLPTLQERPRQHQLSFHPPTVQNRRLLT